MQKIGNAKNLSVHILLYRAYWSWTQEEHFQNLELFPGKNVPTSSQKVEDDCVKSNFC